jgi:DNA (cytosine-5)-methyltransferase 1
MESPILQSPAEEDGLLLAKLAEIYDQKSIATHLNKELPNNKRSRETINRWLKNKLTPNLNYREYEVLKQLLPVRSNSKTTFTFIDLFAGIGGFRRAFENIGGKCLLTSEWDEYAIRTYKANFFDDPNSHVFNKDIRDLTLTSKADTTEYKAYRHIGQNVPDHDLLVAGFPCQPFSIAGVSKKNALGKKHGFEDETQGTLFFDVARILAAKTPSFFLLENVKNLKSHDKGKTFEIIMRTLDDLGYWVSDSEEENKPDPRVIDGKNFLPQHRERIVLIGFRKDLDVHNQFSLKNISRFFPKKKFKLGELLEEKPDEKYILTPKLWEYLYNYAAKHKAKGNGFGYGLVSEDDTTRTLSARYYKDGSEILIDRGFNTNKSFHSKENIKNRPRRLTPRECARLMGFELPGESNFRIPVSDTRAYQQFGNSIVVPAFEAIAKLMKPRILKVCKQKPKLTTS